MRSNLPQALALLVIAFVILGTTVQAKTIAQRQTYYEGDGMVLAVDVVAPGSATWSGTIKLGDQKFPFTAKNEAAAAGGVKLSGAFTADGDSFPFTAEQAEVGSDLTLVSGGSTYRLKSPKSEAPDPLALGRAAAAGALPAELKLKRVEFRDADMGGVVACTMLVPDGWTSEGQVKWSQGDVVYPQKIIEVKSPDDLKIQFVPGMNFAYSETDPAYLAQMRQLGIPNLPKERDGVAPPTEENVGDWLASFVAANNKAVHNVKVVRQERDRPLEEAVRKVMDAAAVNTDAKMFVLGVEYDDDESGGKRMHDELGLTLSVLPTIDLNPTRFTSWSLSITTVVTAPADRFESAKPLLYAIASTLRETPNWWSAKEQTLVELMRIRHEGRMKDIAAVGAAIRQAGQTYSQMSDEQFASWKRRDASSNEIQRRSVNAINSTEDYQLPAGDPNGTSVKLPGLYENVYKPTVGDYYILTNKTLDSADLTKLEPVK